MDLYSRNVLSWRLSNTLTGDFCVDALEAALADARSGIFNTDQGAQFTATREKEKKVPSTKYGQDRSLPIFGGWHHFRH
jgi:transposase InsO family protein